MPTDKLPALLPRPNPPYLMHRDFPAFAIALKVYMDAQDARIAELEQEIREALSIMNGESILSPAWCKQVNEWIERNTEKENQCKPK